MRKQLLREVLSLVLDETGPRLDNFRLTAQVRAHKRSLQTELTNGLPL